MTDFGVREVAISTVPMAPGWAYVPDTGSSASASQPSSRKRMRTLPSASQHETTAKQDAKIMRELAALDRENHRDVSIPVPVRHRDNAGRGVWCLFSLNLHSVLTHTQLAMAKSLQQSERSFSLRRPSQTTSQTTKHSRP
jgi:zinc finger HIT domain-containing protein 1